MAQFYDGLVINHSKFWSHRYRSISHPHCNRSFNALSNFCFFGSAAPHLSIFFSLFKYCDSICLNPLNSISKASPISETQMCDFSFVRLFNPSRLSLRRLGSNCHKCWQEPGITCFLVSGGVQKGLRQRLKSVLTVTCWQHLVIKSWGLQGISTEDIIRLRDC